MWVFIAFKECQSDPMIMKLGHDSVIQIGLSNRFDGLK